LFALTTIEITSTTITIEVKITNVVFFRHFPWTELVDRPPGCLPQPCPTIHAFLRPTIPERAFIPCVNFDNNNQQQSMIITQPLFGFLDPVLLRVVVDSKHEDHNMIRETSKKQRKIRTPSYPSTMGRMTALEGLLGEYPTEPTTLQYYAIGTFDAMSPGLRIPDQLSSRKGAGEPLRSI